MATIQTFWSHKNNVFFRNQKHDVNKVFALVQIKTWTWIRGKYKKAKFTYFDWCLRSITCFRSMISKYDDYKICLTDKRQSHKMLEDINQVKCRSQKERWYNWSELILRTKLLESKFCCYTQITNCCTHCCLLLFMSKHLHYVF